jgi:hypothetical protein
MIVIEQEQGALCVGQAAHAYVSGQLARAWGNDRFAAPDPFDDVCLGAEQHDIGMAEWDLAPALDVKTGLPSSFLRMPLATHLDLWSKAPRKVLSQSPYAALLVSMHGHALYARRDTGEPGTDDSKAVRAFVDRQEAFQAGLIEHLGEDPERARRNQKLLWALDFLSLVLFMRDWIPDTIATPDGDLKVEPAGANAIRVDPWPFAAEHELRVHCHGRRLPGRYGSETELHAALAAAPWLELSFALVR